MSGPHCRACKLLIHIGKLRIADRRPNVQMVCTFIAVCRQAGGICPRAGCGAGRGGPVLRRLADFQHCGDLRHAQESGRRRYLWRGAPDLLFGGHSGRVAASAAADGAAKGCAAAAGSGGRTAAERDRQQARERARRQMGYGEPHRAKACRTRKCRSRTGSGRATGRAGAGDVDRYRSGLCRQNHVDPEAR